MNKITKKHKRGSVLVMALIILSVIVVIGLSLAATTLRNRRSSIESARSNQALQKAESSSEKALDLIAKANAGDTIDNLDWSKIGMSCDSSTGIVEGTLESIELYNDKNEMKSCDDNSITILEIDRIKAVGVSPDTGEKRALMATAVHNGIETCEELQDIEDDPDGDYVLLSDIDCSATNPAVGGSTRWGLIGFDPIEDFRGTLDGQGFVINGLYIKRTVESGNGLFDNILSGAEVKNIGISGEITGNTFIGGLAGSNSGKISNVYFVGSINGASSFAIGGLIGQNKTSGDIYNSYANAKIKGGDQVGGLVGRNSGLISKSFFSGSIEGDKRLGGISGYNNITNGEIYDSYAVGYIVGSDKFIGGLIGYGGYNVLERSYSAMKITAPGSYVGGFIGTTSAGSGNIEDPSFWDKNITSQSDSCGGSTCDSDIKDESTFKMQKKNTFSSADWDISGINNNDDTLWKIDNDGTYPCHKWWLDLDEDNECPK